MLDGRLAIGLFVAYAAALLGIARWGERPNATLDRPAWRRAIYVLSTCVVYGVGSFWGSLSIAAHRGVNFLPIVLGPILVFAFGRPLIIRMVRAARAQNLTSISDLVAARYGKSTHVAATITTIVAAAAIPALAIQMRLLAQSLGAFAGAGTVQADGTAGSRADLVFVGAVLAALTVALGTRWLDATTYRRGLLLAVACESILRLVAVTIVGLFAICGIFGGLGNLTEAAVRAPVIDAIVDTPLEPGLWLAAIVTTMAVVMVDPRVFYVAVVGNRDEDDVRTAAWFFPLYVVALSLFIMPMAVAGLVVHLSSAGEPGLVMLTLPLHANNAAFAALALLGQFSIATCAAVLTAAATGTMITNDLVLPLVLRRTGSGRTIPILALRRLAIFALFCASTILTAETDRASIIAAGIVAVAAIAQIAPGMVIGFVWPRGTARGALGGALAGLAIVAYTLILPAMAPGSVIMTDGPLGLSLLRPTALFGLEIDPFAQAMVWSLTINVLTYLGLSLSRPFTANEKLQAGVFRGTGGTHPVASFRLQHTTLTIGEVATCIARFVEPGVARSRLEDWHASRDLAYDETRQVDPSLLQTAEELLATSVGTASSRKIVSLLLQDRAVSAAAARQMIDDAAFEIQNSRDMLQRAIDVARDGMAVYDAELRLIAWNRAYRDMFQFPSDIMRVGTPLDVLVRSNAERGVYGPGDVDRIIGPRVEALLQPTEGSRLYSAPFGRVLEMRSIRLGNGGLFFTYTDATAQATSEEELEAENLTLERRVRERTEELERLNVELIRAKAEAEDANVSKSRFLAAASHDLLQPLSAARLYTTSLRERLRVLALGDATSMLASNIDTSLEAVEDILGALLEISHLDAGAIRTDVMPFGVGELLRHLQLEFEPQAHERGLDLRVVGSSLRVTSDRKLLRRMLQNLISNAIKYTHQGRVLVGVRRHGDRVRFYIHDTGIGIPESKRKVIFREFERLPAGAEVSPGAGLGLSIVERLSHVLDHPVEMRSIVEKGTLFTVTAPYAEVDSTLVVGQPVVRQRSLDGMTVAAIDNEPHILSAIKLLLQGWDCRVASGTGLYEIERALVEMDRGPDVIVADYHIGESDGLEVITRLRDLYGPLPAVLVTADRSPVVRDLAQAADVRVLHKPLKPAALRALLSQWHLVKATVD